MSTASRIVAVERSKGESMLIQRVNRLAEIARRNRQEIIAAALSRREMFKLGLLTSAGYLVAKKLGLSRRRDALTRDGHSASLMIGDEAGGQWMRNSAVDNPAFLATTIGTFFGWTSRQPAKSYAEVSSSRMPEKREYFFQSRCGACHTIGDGDRVGPDLAGVTKRRDRAWLSRYLAEPDRMRAEGDPIATALFAKYNNVPMPNLRLSGIEVAGLLSYLEAQGGGGRGSQQEAAPVR